jgi:hypothetical protein
MSKERRQVAVLLFLMTITAMLILVLNRLSVPGVVMGVAFVVLLVMAVAALVLMRRTRQR